MNPANQIDSAAREVFAYNIINNILVHFIRVYKHYLVKGNDVIHRAKVDNNLKRDRYRGREGDTQ